MRLILLVGKLCVEEQLGKIFCYERTKNMKNFHAPKIIFFPRQFNA